MQSKKHNTESLLRTLNEALDERELDRFSAEITKHLSHLSLENRRLLGDYISRKLFRIIQDYCSSQREKEYVFQLYEILKLINRLISTKMTESFMVSAREIIEVTWWKDALNDAMKMIDRLRLSKWQKLEAKEATETLERAKEKSQFVKKS